MTHKKVIIVGSGPAGHTAAIYAGKALLEPLMFEGFMAGGIAAGGQLTTTTVIENFPGFPTGIDGSELMIHMRQQSLNSGAQIQTLTVDSVDLSSKPFKVNVGNETYTADTLIIATGATAKRMGIKGEVVVLVRRDALRASKAMQERALNNPKITFMRNTEAEEAHGDKLLTGVSVINNKTGEKSLIECSGLFYAIGHQPNTSFLNGQLELDEAGYIKTQPGTTQTSVAWVFAAGDVQDKKYRQAITSAGSGCMAALEAEKYLQELN